jgi:hypothetical protein
VGKVKRILKLSCECNKGICVLSRCGVYNDVLTECYNPRDADQIIERLVLPGFDPSFAYAFCIGCAAPVKWEWDQPKTTNEAYERLLTQVCNLAEEFKTSNPSIYQRLRSLA